MRCLTSNLPVFSVMDHRNPTRSSIQSWSCSRYHGTYLVPSHEYLLRDVELEKLGVEVVHETRNQSSDVRCDLLDGVGIMRGEIQEVREVRYSVVERCFDEDRVNFLGEDDWAAGFRSVH